MQFGSRKARKGAKKEAIKFKHSFHAEDAEEQRVSRKARKGAK